MKQNEKQSNYPSNRLAALRISAGLSVKTLSELAQVSPTLINLLENNKRNFTEDNTERLAAALFVDKELLLGISNYGVWVVDNAEEHTWKNISFADYLHQKQLGNIIEKVETKAAIRLLDFDPNMPSDQAYEETGEYKKTFSRIMDFPDSKSAEFMNATKEEIFKAVAGMSQSQLDSLLIIIKEAITKIK